MSRLHSESEYYTVKAVQDISAYILAYGERIFVMGVALSAIDAQTDELLRDYEDLKYEFSLLTLVPEEAPGTLFGTLFGTAFALCLAVV